MARGQLQKVMSIQSKAKVKVRDDPSANLRVAVRVRPVLKSGVRASEATQKDIMRVLNGNVVKVEDPDEEKLYLDKVQGRTKEKMYTYDVACDQQSTNLDIFNRTIQDMCLGCMEGRSVTVFAYGATGSGKTYTMVGTEQDPGLMVRSLERVFQAKEEIADEDVALTCSYIEVYNEVVYDLLVAHSGALDLREDPKQGVCVAGIKRHAVSTPREIMSLLQEGNRRRKTDATGANATSSRSHAVLEIRVTRKRLGAKGKPKMGKLCLVDLAGSERASETDNMGQKLRDGANINKSLLALANCINALGKAAQGKGGKPYVPYRNSKLTRLLKDGLSGNSQTAMIATVSGSADQYQNSINTLKYADRAKEIKTNPNIRHAEMRVAEAHVPDYQRIITDLQTEVQGLQDTLEAIRVQDDVPVPATASLHKVSELERLRWLNKMSGDISANSEARINLQKALLELEDATVCNKAELLQLEEYLQSDGLTRAEKAGAQERLRELKSGISDNEAEGTRIREEIEENEAERRNLAAEIELATRDNNDAPFLQMVMTFRMEALKLQEQTFQSAVRDQIINEQRSVINNLWQVIESSGMCREDIEAIGRRQGLMMDGLAEHLPSVPGGTLNRGATKGLFATMRQAGNRAHARFEFWRNRNRRPGGRGEAQPVPAGTMGGVSGVLQSIKRFWGAGAGGTTGGGPTRGRTNKVAVAPVARPF